MLIVSLSAMHISAKNKNRATFQTLYRNSQEIVLNLFEEKKKKNFYPMLVKSFGITSRKILTKTQSDIELIKF